METEWVMVAPAASPMEAAPVASSAADEACSATWAGRGNASSGEWGANYGYGEMDGNDSWRSGSSWDAYDPWSDYKRSFYGTTFDDSCHFPAAPAETRSEPVRKLVPDYFL